MDQGTRQLTGIRAALARLNRHGGRVAGCDIQVDQAVVQLRDGRRIIPAKAQVQTEFGSDAPIVVDEEIVSRAAEILVGVAVAYGTGGRGAQQEVGQVCLLYTSP